MKTICSVILLVCATNAAAGCYEDASYDTALLSRGIRSITTSPVMVGGPKNDEGAPPQNAHGGERVVATWSSVDGAIRLQSGFCELPRGTRRAVIAHEIGHAISAAMRMDIRVDPPPPWHDDPMEIQATAFALALYRFSGLPPLDIEAAFPFPGHMDAARRADRSGGVALVNGKVLR